MRSAHQVEVEHGKGIERRSQGADPQFSQRRTAGGPHCVSIKGDSPGLFPFSVKPSVRDVAALSLFRVYQVCRKPVPVDWMFIELIGSQISSVQLACLVLFSILLFKIPFHLGEMMIVH